MGNIKEDIKKAEKCENISDFLTVKFLEPSAMCFSKLFLKMNMHPNTVTIISTIFGIAGGILFYFKTLYLNIIGIFLEILCSILDVSDGQVARLSGKKSEFGRILDGLCDGIVYASIYISLCFRLMTENIPFTSILWGAWIWPIGIFCGLILHSGQARMVDYFKNAHMLFKQNKKGNEISLSKNIALDLKNDKDNFFKKFRKWPYLFYTKLQECRAPYLHKLLLAVDTNGGGVPDDVSEAFTTESVKIVKRTNLLNVNLRSYTLFILLIFKYHVFIFPFIVLVLEPICWYLTYRYDKIAKNILRDYYTQAVSNEI